MCWDIYCAQIVFLTSDHCLFLFSKKKKEITVFSHFSFKFCFLGLHFGFKFKFEDRGEHSIPCWVGIKSYGNGEVTIHFLGHYLWSMKRKAPVLWPTSNIERKLSVLWIVSVPQPICLCKWSLVHTGFQLPSLTQWKKLIRFFSNIYV